MKCPKCGTEVETRELLALGTGGKIVEVPLLHMAPCGHPCSGAPHPVDWIVDDWHPDGCPCAKGEASL